MRSYALACEPATVDLPDAFDDGVLKKRKPFNPDHFPLHQQRFRDLLAGGQHSKTLFIGCSDSRIVPHLLGGADPGELIMVRNDGAMVPPCKGSHGLHGTTVAIEFAVQQLERLMNYPMVRRAVEAGDLTLHGWHYVIEDGDVRVFDARRAAFIPASVATHIDAGPYGGALQSPSLETS